MAASLDRRTLTKLAGGSAAALLAGAAPVSAQDAPGLPTELVIGRGQEAAGLDPATQSSAASTDLIMVVYERLVEFREMGEPQPMLAEAWEMPDDLTCVFTLRPDVIFHNGQPLTATDVKQSLDRLRNPETGSPWADRLAIVETIEATDSATVTVRLSAPHGPLLATLASSYASIVPADASLDLETEMIGTGPFQLESWAPAEETVLAAFGGYWIPEEPQVDTVRWRVMPEEAARLEAIRAGDLQITGIADPLVIEDEDADSAVRVVEQETTDFYLLGFNTAEAPFDDAKVRRALSLAIDRQAIIDRALVGHGQMTGPIVPTLGDWAQPVEQLPNYTLDRDRARELLEEAGRAGLRLSMLVGSLYPEFARIAEAIRDQLATIDVTVELEQVEWSTFIERWRERDFESYLSFTSSGFDPDSTLYETFRTDGERNSFGFADEEVDRMLESGRTAVDPEARRTIYQNLEIALTEAVPAIFIATRVDYFAVRAAVRGFQPTAAQTWATLSETTVAAEE